jgi:hypothetical protein
MRIGGTRRPSVGLTGRSEKHPEAHNRARAGDVFCLQQIYGNLLEIAF